MPCMPQDTTLPRDPHLLLHSQEAMLGGSMCALDPAGTLVPIVM